jgi:hypothetical protein
MNFRTTLILLVCLVIVGGYVMFTSRSNSTQSVQNTNPQRVVDVTSADVTKLIITPSGEPPIVLIRSTQTGSAPQIGPAVSDWKITAPQSVYADGMKVSDLLDAVVNATSTAQVGIGSNAADYGLDSPQFTIELDAGMKTLHLDIGRKEQAGNELYVRLEGNDNAQVIAADLLDRLNDATVDKLRLARVVNADATAVNWLNIERPTDSLTLEKVAGQWQMSLPGKHPTTAPVEQSVAGDMISSINNMQATEFAAADADAKTLIGVTPQATVTLSSQALPTTQPSVMSETVEFGLPDSLLGKNVWVRAMPPGSTFKIAKETQDSILKSSLDLRNRNVVQIDPDNVSEVRIVKLSPATTKPFNIPAGVRQVVLARRPPKPAEAAGPKLPSTHPTTIPATQPETVWQLRQNRIPADADDSKVTTLLSNFNPLKADQYLAAAPPGAGRTTYMVTITLKTGSPITIEFTDPGESSSDSPTGVYGDLNFNVARAVITSLDSDFAK